MIFFYLKAILTRCLIATEKRGLYYEDELTALVELAGTPNDLQAQAAKALALFLHGTPSEFTLSHETISSAIAQSKECLTYMLDEAEAGNVREHLVSFQSVAI